MTLMLIALWIAGHSFQWYWLIASVAVDLIWLSIKLNFLAMLVRRSVEESQASAEPSSGGGQPPAV
jgi:hypothetical protein